MQPNRYQDLRKKLRRRKPRKQVTLEDALLYQGAAVVAAWEELALNQQIGNTGGVISAIHAVTQANQALAAMMEKNDLRKEIEDLRREIEALR